MMQPEELQSSAQGKKPFRFTLVDAGIVFSCFILANFALSLVIELALIALGYDPAAELAGNSVLIWIVQVVLHVVLLMVSVVFYAVKKGKFFQETTLNRPIKGKDLFYSLCLMVAMFYLANMTTNVIVLFLEALGYRMSSGVAIDSWFAFGMAMLGIVILPAFSEELVFRGIVFQGLKRYGKAAAIFGSALLFGIMHMNVVQFIYAFQCGLLLGLVVYKTDNIKYGIIMHGLSNLISVVVTFATSGMTDSQLTESPLVVALSLVMFAVSVLCLALGLVYFLKNRPKEPWETPAPAAGFGPYPGQAPSPYGQTPPRYGMPNQPYAGPTPPPYVQTPPAYGAPVPPNSYNGAPYQGNSGQVPPYGAPNQPYAGQTPPPYMQGQPYAGQMSSAPGQQPAMAAMPTVKAEEKAAVDTVSADSAARAEDSASQPVAANAEGAGGQTQQSPYGQTPPAYGAPSQPYAGQTPPYMQGQPNPGQMPPPYGQTPYMSGRPYAGPTPPPYIQTPPAYGAPVPPNSYNGAPYQGNSGQVPPYGAPNQPYAGQTPPPYMPGQPYAGPIPPYGAPGQPYPAFAPLYDPEREERKRDKTVGFLTMLPGLLACLLMLAVDLFGSFLL